MSKLSLKALDLFGIRPVKDMQMGVPFYEAFHADRRWRKVRNEFVHDRQPVCQMCGYHKNLEVHHALPWHMYPDFRYSYCNLITLCDACHFRYGHYHNWKNYNSQIFWLVEQTQIVLKHVGNWGSYKNNQRFLDAILGNDNP